MTDRERLLKILNVPIYPHENVDPLEAVADYLIDNGVRLEAEQATSDKASKVVEIDQFNKWIPVTERLPEIGGCYIVALKYKYDFEKEYTYDTDVATFHFGYDRGYIDGQWNTYVDWDEGQQYLHVTHWMPLPEPPKEDV